MFQTVFNSQTIFVLDDPWDGTAPLHATFSVIRDEQPSLTGREGRRSYSSTLRVELKYPATVQGASLRKLQGCLRALTTEPVITPFWPSVARWADRAAMPISGGLKIVWKSDWSQFEIYTGVEPVWPTANDHVAAALFGFIKPGEPVMLNPDAAIWQVEFTESSPAEYALLPAAFVPPAGPQPPGYLALLYLFPFRPDFHDVSEEISVEIKRDRIGFRREHYQTFYPQTSARGQKASYSLTGTEAGQLLRFFQDIAGRGYPFWNSGWLQVARLTQDAASGETVLNVEDTNGVNIGDYVSLFSVSSAIARKIVDKTANTLTLQFSAGVPLNKADTCIFPLCLAKLNKPSVKISWESLETATCELEWTELPPEYAPAADETLNQTLGKLPERVVLFHFSRDFGNGTVLTQYFTNYERDLSWNGQTWLHSSFSCGEISQSLNLEDDGVEITSFKFTGNPLIEDVTKRGEAPLSVVIRFADFEGATVSNPQIIFTGTCSSPSRNGNTLKVKCKFGPAVLDTQLPFFIRGPVCNHLRGSNLDGSFLISAGCTLLRNDWKFTALVAAPVSAGYPYTVQLTNLSRVTGAVPTYFANWFAGGVIEWGAGANIQRRFITGSSNPVGGVLSVTLHRYFNSLPAIGDTVTLTPACDGIYTTCKAYNVSTNPTGKFNNFLNFGGEPFIPAGNPSFTGQPNVGVHGGKK